MSTADPVRWAECGWPGGDVPGENAFRHVPPPTVCAHLERALEGRFGAVQDVRALAVGTGLAGRYRVSAADRIWFVRVSEVWGYPDLEADILRFLDSSGVPVNAPVDCGIHIEQEPKGPDFRLDIRPFLEGARPFAGTLDDLVELGRTLQSCHKALRSFGKSGRIRDLALERYNGFAQSADWLSGITKSSRWQAFRELEGWASEQREWLADLVAGFSPRFAEDAAAQCLHGEIHRANVLYLEGRAVLLDFEEAVHNYAAPDWDLAYLVQRFCLHDEPEQGKFLERRAAVEQGYGSRLPDLRPFMQQLAWMAAVILVELCIRDRQIKPAAEYAKFVKLEKQARNLDW